MVSLNSNTSSHNSGYQVLELILKASNKIDICINSIQPQLFTENKKLMNSLSDSKGKGIKVRCITEITVNNVPYCKILMNAIEELRHSEGIRPNFMLSEREYLLSPLGINKVESNNKEQELNQKKAIYGDMKDLVDQQQFIFDTLWNDGISAEERIRKLETGGNFQEYEIKVIRNPPDIVKVINNHIEESSDLLICTICSGGMQFMAENFLEAKKKVIDKQKKGQHSGIKYIGDLNRHTADAGTKFIDAGVNLRHLKVPPQMSFSISDKQVITTIDEIQGNNKVQSLLISNDPIYLNHFKNIFENLWFEGIDAKIIIGNATEGKETDYESTVTRRYVDEVMMKISRLKNDAKQRGMYVS
jgi:two-component system, OmpR family, sensor histidine kinase VicK